MRHFTADGSFEPNVIGGGARTFLGTNRGPAEEMDAQRQERVEQP
jgi:hypothetical protein